MCSRQRACYLLPLTWCTVLGRKKMGESLEQARRLPSLRRAAPRCGGFWQLQQRVCPRAFLGTARKRATHLDASARQTTSPCMSQKNAQGSLSPAGDNYGLKRIARWAISSTYATSSADNGP